MTTRARSSAAGRPMQTPVPAGTSVESRLREITYQSHRSRALDAAQDKWKVTKRGIILRMEVEESVLLPFNAAKVNAAVCQYTASGSIQVVGDIVRCGVHSAVAKGPHA